MFIDYFAFGSNLSSPRLLQRIPRASVRCIASLQGHRLHWHKNGRDRSGKCDMHPSGHPGDQVYGVIYRMSHADQLELDAYEGEGRGYQRRQIHVTASHGELMPVFTYFATDVNHRLQPFHWYKEHVLRGAVEHGLPRHYVAHIRSVESKPDHDSERHLRELSIYAETI